MNLQQAIEAAQQLRKTTDSGRSFGRALWSLACCYAYGNQWAYLSPQRRGLREARQLRDIVDPKRTDIRVHMNEIRHAIEWMRGALNPQSMEAFLTPSDASMEATVIKDVGEKLLNRHLIDTNALSVYRRVNEMRLVLGTGIIRRTLKNNRTIKRGNVKIRDIKPGWAAVYPYEVLRDPAANTCDPGTHEEQYGYEKPRTLGWIEENWGLRIPENEIDTKLGDLIDYQRELQSASSGGMDRHSQDSVAKAVLFYEFYFKDASDGPGWVWMLPCYARTQSDPDELIPLADELIPNPFQPPPATERLAALGLPFHHMNYEAELGSMWGTGIPHILMAGQDVYNLALTWYLRMLQAGGGKIIYDVDTIEDPANAFSNRIDTAIPYNSRKNRQAKQPSRLAGPTIPSAAEAFVGMMPEWMNRQLNRTPVQSGITSPRGESGRAVTAKLEAAGMPLEDRRRTDELALQDLLYATWLDVANPKLLRLDQAKRLLGEDTPQSHILALLRDPPHMRVRTVTVKRSMLRPKSPGETRDEYIKMGVDGILDPMAVQHQLVLRGDSVNDLMMAAIQKQTMELEAIIAGAKVAPPAMEDDHATHLFACQLFINSPKSMAVSPEAMQEIMRHTAQHRYGQAAINSLEMQLEQGAQQQGSPPAEAVGAGMPTEALSPAMT